MRGPWRVLPRRLGAESPGEGRARRTASGWVGQRRLVGMRKAEWSMQRFQDYYGFEVSVQISLSVRGCEPRGQGWAHIRGCLAPSAQWEQLVTSLPAMVKLHSRLPTVMRAGNSVLLGSYLFLGMYISGKTSCIQGMV